MKARAKELGFVHGRLVRSGDTFEIAEAEFTDVWMARVAEDVPITAPPAPQGDKLEMQPETKPATVPETLSQMAKRSREKPKVPETLSDAGVDLT